MLKYDIHNHTHYSPCSNLKPEILLKVAKKKGFNGIGIVDHHTIKGALKVKGMNKDKDFEVIVGSEITTNYGDVLCLYINKDIKSRNFFSLVDEVKKQDGLIIIPHPFRKSLNKNHTFKIPIEKIKNKIDAIECFNARMLPLGDNEKAQRLAKKLNIAGTGGSDAHFRFEIGTGWTTFEGNFRKALKRKETKYHGRIFLGPFGGLLSYLRNRLRLYKIPE
ncbi:PHP domain-containing protein [Candidatus Woesearchaeota archaeon]|nr:PHP domain-containing protein [Candidatus Woesearchaeota archaeon]